MDAAQGEWPAKLLKVSARTTQYPEISKTGATGGSHPVPLGSKERR